MQPCAAATTAMSTAPTTTCALCGVSPAANPVQLLDCGHVFCLADLAACLHAAAGDGHYGAASPRGIAPARCPVCPAATAPPDKVPVPAVEPTTTTTTTTTIINPAALDVVGHMDGIIGKGQCVVRKGTYDGRPVAVKIYQVAEAAEYRQ